MKNKHHYQYGGVNRSSFINLVIMFVIALVVNPVFAVEPTGISNLTLWLDANDIDGDGTAEGTSEGGLLEVMPGVFEVQSWIDKSAANNDVTALSAPVLMENTLNSKAVLDFDSSSLKTAAAGQITANTGYTKVVVFSFDANNAGDGNNLISSSGTDHALWGNYNNSDTIRMWHNGDFLQTDGIIESVYYIVTARYGFPDGVTNIINLDGVERNVSSDVHPFTSIEATEIGSFSGDNYLDGKIAEAIIYDRALSATEVVDIECYLSEKWGITVPAAHACTGNQSPTDIKIDGADADSVADNTPTGNTVGALTTVDSDAGDSHSYSLVAGTGDEDNGKFSINGSNLNLAFTPDFSNPSDLGDTAGNNTYSVLIQTDDGSSTAFKKAFIITVIDPDPGSSPSCATVPPFAKDGQLIVTTCAGVANGATLSIPAMICGAESNNQVQCSGVVGTNVTVSNDVVSVNGSATSATTGLTIDNITPTAAVCVFTPNMTSTDVQVTANCSGVEPNGSVAIPEMNCSAESAGNVTCTGTSSAIGANPAVITKDAATNAVSTTGNFTFDNSPPTAASCTFSPNIGNTGTVITATCSGVETDGSVSIVGLTCGLETATIITCTGNAEDIGNSAQITTTDALGNATTSTSSGGFTFAPIAATCSFTPDSGSGATQITATCTGVETGGSISITGMTCNAAVGGAVTCTGTAANLTANPVITTIGALGNSTTSSASGFSLSVSSGGGGGSLRWPLFILLLAGLLLRREKDMQGLEPTGLK